MPFPEEYLPRWARAVFALLALLTAFYLARGLWIGEIVVYGFLAKSQAYVGSTASKISLTTPQGLAGGSLQLGGIALLFAVLAVYRKHGRSPWLLAPPILMLIVGTAVLRQGGWR
jgi:hypothetical protein